MKILAIETSTLTGSVALLEDGMIRAETTLSVSVKHSERLMPAIDRLLQDAGESLESVDLFAASVGPGSFTGIRIAVATVQAFCLALPETGLPDSGLPDSGLQKPSMSISSLQALACNGSYFSGLVVPLLDARRSEVYAGIYRMQGPKPPQIVGEEMAIDPHQLVERLNAPHFARVNLLFLGEGSLVYRDLINRELKGRALFAAAPLNFPRAAQVANLAWLQMQQGVAPDRLMMPRYVRPAEVSFPLRKVVN